MLPPDFTSLMRQELGPKEADALFRALEAGDTPVSIRLNPLKRVGEPVDAEPVPWCPDAYYLSERPAFTFDPLFHAGAYYVQEASSMFLYQAVKDLHPRRALDLCAAPGGKSTLLAATLPPDCQLVSNEPHPQRARTLAENMAKWGRDNVIVTQQYPNEFAPLAGAFDLIVCDVPCSGEGMFRKDEQARREWSLQAVAACQRRQRDIVETIWPCLAPGGTLVYSTCTFNAAEDDDNVRYLAQRLGADIVPLPHPAEWHITERDCGYHFYPGRTRGEGFYLAVLTRGGEASSLTGSAGFIPATASSVRPRAVAGIKPALPVSVALTYPQAIQYLRGEALRIDIPRGEATVTYRGLALGRVKGVGSRANNLYPKEWRIRTTYDHPEPHIIL